MKKTVWILAAALLLTGCGDGNDASSVEQTETTAAARTTASVETDAASTDVTQVEKEVRPPAEIPGTLCLIPQSDRYPSEIYFLTVTVNNGEDTAFCCTDEFTLEYKGADGEWSMVGFKNHTTFSAQEETVAPMTRMDMVLPFSYFFMQPFAGGEYRVVVNGWNPQPDGTEVRRTVTAEFTIEAAADAEIPDVLCLVPAQETYPTEIGDLKVTLNNGTETDFCYSAEFYLEREENGAWVKLPYKPDMAFAVPAKTIPAGKQTVLRLSASFYYDMPLTAGKYRVCVPGRWNSHVDGESVIASGEFTIT